MGYGKYCSSEWCYQSDNTFRDIGKPVVAVVVADPGETPVSVPLDTDSSFTVSTNGAGRVAFSLHFDGQIYRITNLPDSCFENPFECEETLGEFTNQDVLQMAVDSGEFTISRDAQLPWFVDEVFIESADALVRLTLVENLGKRAAQIELVNSAVLVKRVEAGTGTEWTGGQCVEMSFSELAADRRQARIISDQKIANGNGYDYVFSFAESGSLGFHV